MKEVVGAAFAHRRKTLANSLQQAGLAKRDDVFAALGKIDRPLNVRAEELEPPEFVALAAAL